MKESRHGLVIVSTGNGKGKTTSALGTALRAIGWDCKVLIVQFYKGRWNPGEREAIKKYSLPIDYRPFGSGFSWNNPDKEQVKSECCEAWSFLKEEIQKAEYDLIIADEINIALSRNILDVDDVLHALKNREKSLHVILTGRNAPDEIKKYADLISVIDAYKHPFKKGIAAQKGIEF